MRRRTEPYKGTNLEINLHPHQGQAQLLVLVEKLNQLIIPRRVVVAGELLEDGDMDMEFPAHQTFHQMNLQRLRT